MQGVFQGQFKHGYLHGKVIANFQFGDSYVGEYFESAMTGYGTYQFNDGTKITGYFENGTCNRHGKKIYPDGRVYIGEFLNDVENGKGVLIIPDKVTGQMRKISGIWYNAQLAEELVVQHLKPPGKETVDLAYNMLQK